MPVILTNDFPPERGGIQRVMSRMADSLQKAGHPVIVVAPQRSGSNVADECLPYRVIRYREFGHRYLAVIGMLPAYLRAVRSVADQTTIASIWWPAGFAAAVVPETFRGRLAVLAHGSEIMPQKRGLRRRAMRFVFDRARIIFSNSSFTSGLLRECGVTKNVAILPLATDQNDVTRATSPVPTILSVGRLVRRKGFDRTLQAIARVRSDYPAIRYVIVGSGPQENELRALAKSLDCESNVVFCKSLDDRQLQNAYSEAWLFALPTRRIIDDVEGFGLVFLEAAMAQLPSVGGIDSGAADAIVDGETGFLVDGTNVESIEHSLRTLLDDHLLRTRLGENGRRRALTLTWENTVQTLISAMELS